MNDDSPPVKSSKATYWMIYLGLLVAAIVLIGDGLSISHLERWTGRVGIGVLFMTLVLIASRSVARVVIASGIVWLAVILTFLY